MSLYPAERVGTAVPLNSCHGTYGCFPLRAAAAAARSLARMSAAADSAARLAAAATASATILASAARDASSASSSSASGDAACCAPSKPSEGTPAACSPRLPKGSGLASAAAVGALPPAAASSAAGSSDSSEPARPSAAPPSGSWPSGCAASSTPTAGTRPATDVVTIRRDSCGKAIESQHGIPDATTAATCEGAAVGAAAVATSPSVDAAPLLQHAKPPEFSGGATAATAPLSPHVAMLPCEAPAAGWPKSQLAAVAVLLQFSGSVMPWWAARRRSSSSRSEAMRARVQLHVVARKADAV